MCTLTGEYLGGEPNQPLPHALGRTQGALLLGALVRLVHKVGDAAREPGHELLPARHRTRLPPPDRLMARHLFPIQPRHRAQAVGRGEGDVQEDPLAVRLEEAANARG